MAVLTLPKDRVEEMAGRLLSAKVRGFWNFTGKELDAVEAEGIIVENVHLGDSLMILDYKLSGLRDAGEGEENR
jgi:redox-sensing transcriptional repressor